MVIKLFDVLIDKLVGSCHSRKSGNQELERILNNRLSLSLD
ncbi:uncharacterized protein METZ01_LOCUS51365 [marine metagenome]|uniref:Uncharacterized protein n=1 Tax=marine metagenome TaxID=408172 RepID=A0A381S5B5_9ZZZZ